MHAHVVVEPELVVRPGMVIMPELGVGYVPRAGSGIRQCAQGWL